MKVIWEEVEKHYAQKNSMLTALGPVSLSLESGSFTVLIGPSGCGKSTLLSITAGLLKPDSGRVSYEDAPENPVKGMVFQEIGLLPWMTIAENIALGLHTLSPEERTARVRHWLGVMGLSSFSAAWPHQLSGGMRQRAGIARALAMEPDLLLMDEPFSALDAQTRTLLCEELLELRKTIRATTLYITHNISEAVCLADRILVMSRRPGRIIADITPDVREKSAAGPGTAGSRLEKQIWDLLRSEAETAMQEGT